jgi:Holliday junction resolvase
MNQGLVESASISLAGGTAKILSLTEEGRQVLGLPAVPSSREGGLVHRYWKACLAEHLKASGYEVVEEYPVGGGKTIDLVAIRDGRRIAFEIETGKSDAAANVRKWSRADINKVIVVATTAVVRNALSLSLPKDSAVLCLTGPEVMNGRVSADWPYRFSPKPS